MNDEIVPSDIAILDLLRKNQSLGIAELAKAMQVTATAVRQRLTRLMAQGYIDRAATRAGRGRPSHRYVLTEKGQRKTGANFADLAIALWDEVRAIKDPEVRTGLLKRIAQRLAAQYSSRITGVSLEEKMQALAALFNQKRIPFTVDWKPEKDPNSTERLEAGRLPVLKALACPYPSLAERDRSVCAMERLMFSEALGENVKLSECRLDGDSCCSFEAQVPATCEV